MSKNTNRSLANVGRCQECQEEFELESRLRGQDIDSWRDDVCYSCNYWLRHIAHKEGLVIDGEHFMVLDEDVTDPFRGFGGLEYVIQVFDEGTIITRNLWTQGTIPDHFRSRLPDNARFLTPGDGSSDKG